MQGVYFLLVFTEVKDRIWALRKTFFDWLNMIQAIRNAGLFLRKFISSPKKIGAIAPSSPALARQIVNLANVKGAKTVLELVAEENTGCS